MVGKEGEVDVFWEKNGEKRDAIRSALVRLASPRPVKLKALTQEQPHL